MLRRLLLVLPLALFGLSSLAHASKYKAQKPKASKVQKQKNKTRRFQHRLPTASLNSIEIHKYTNLKDLAAAFKKDRTDIKWANQHGKGRKLVLVNGAGETLRYSRIDRPNGNIQHQTLNESTGETVSYFKGIATKNNPATEVTVTKQKNGDWVKQQVQASGLVRVSSNKTSKRELTFEVPAGMTAVHAKRLGRSLAKTKNKQVTLRYQDGSAATIIKARR